MNDYHTTIRKKIGLKYYFLKFLYTTKNTPFDVLTFLTLIVLYKVKFSPQRVATEEVPISKCGELSATFLINQGGGLTCERED